MKKKTLIIIISIVLAVVIGGTTAAIFIFSGNKEGKKRDSIVIMTEELSGLFNPYYATSGADMDVVGMTQIGMLSTDSQGNTVAGDDYPTVVKDFEYKISDDGKETVYTFVLKNGLKFSDGKPLTMNDVMFNIYEYLDPVYTGSSTMYSIKIKGLSQYRLQQNYSGGNEEQESAMSAAASDSAKLRLLELVNLFEEKGKKSDNSYNLSESGTREEIEKAYVTVGYKNAVASAQEQQTMTDADYRAILMSDYDLTLKTFKEELVNDFKAAKESYDLTAEPYKSWADDSHFGNDIFKFLFFEGYITPVYEKVLGKDNKNKIESFSGESIFAYYKDKGENAVIEYIFNDYVSTKLNQVLQFWGTSGTLMTQYTAKALDIALHENVVSGELAIPNIEGVVSLGHTTTTTTVKVKGNDYTVAREYNEDGTVKNTNEYAVLQITVDGTDPKAIYNFGFTVAPCHYYSADAEHPNGRTVDIKNNKFGVDWASSDFQSKTIQSQQHVEIPVGAGAFMATDANGSDNPQGSAFVSSNIVYYKANHNFMFPVKAEKLRMQVVSSSNAIDKLVSGEVDYVTPQFTKANSERLESLAKQGLVQLNSWQLGYGYIGVNAGKIPNINIRKAIMAAMQTSLALEFYAPSTCENIDWPMSKISWAYPYEADGVTSKSNGKDYLQFTSIEAAKKIIKKYMDLAPEENLEITFTIAGSSITEHPTYPVFKQAAEILNDMGWNITVKADSQALTKLSTGSLSVWAAAWGSTIDPDMYQVYHKNSSATSVYSWGYREIKSNPTLYSEEMSIINELSDLIDDGRETMDKDTRKRIYEEAMGLVLDLAVEMPVYQRKTLYAYNSKTIKGLNNDVNPYSSPLEKIWEIELA